MEVTDEMVLRALNAWDMAPPQALDEPFPYPADCDEMRWMRAALEAALKAAP